MTTEQITALISVIDHTVHTIVFRVECPTPEKTRLLDALREVRLAFGLIQPEAVEDGFSNLPPSAEVLHAGRAEEPIGGSQ